MAFGKVPSSSPVAMIFWRVSRSQLRCQRVRGERTERRVLARAARKRVGRNCQTRTEYLRYPALPLAACAWERTACCVLLLLLRVVSCVQGERERERLK